LGEEEKVMEYYIIMNFVVVSVVSYCIGRLHEREKAKK